MLSQSVPSSQNPKIANETSDITLVWNYSIGGTAIFARFLNVTGGGSDRTGILVDGRVEVEAKYQDRFRANLSDSQAWLKILQVQRSDKGKYQFDLSRTSGSPISSQLDLIVHCKYLPLLIQM